MIHRLNNSMTVDFVVPIDISSTVEKALGEDIGSGDITASLVPSDATAVAEVISRERAILCGTPWFNEVFHKIDPNVVIEWFVREGASLDPDFGICRMRGNAASILSGERTALNFLQTLSGTATTTREYVAKVAPWGTRILDTRKTIPGLRSAQKYAVRVGGGINHRFGLYDGILIKENHQNITCKLDAIIENLPEVRPDSLLIEVEIENLDQLTSALDSKANRIMLDNFDVADIQKAVELVNGRVELEASGNFTLDNIEEVAMTGVDYISIGALTKHVRAIDFSMGIISE